MINIGNDWDELLKPEFDKEYYQELRKFLVNEYKTQKIHPDMDEIFSALKLSSYKDTKILLLGQDPYHGEGQAHGLAFSVKPGITPPPSLKNMYKEIESELGIKPPNNGYLVSWAKQGILMINTVLTVRDGLANSHKGRGWEIFTDRIIELLNEKDEPVIFILWGNNAKTKKKLITNKNHFIIEGVHPSPLSASRGFFGCGHFKKVNEILKSLGKKEIDWSIPNL
ncbi:uracil-DNA glycosylase [Fusobacterium sp.]|uniref:uracil-DNA glycosylase n=1 Tax=Fusobacterium sp. TaxID=68766 RepID=UPI002634A5BA|nr:uracil-DNA glycosylase [Fusobacterium sp.]